MLRTLFYKLFTLFSIQSKKVLFFSYYGAQYGGSPKYISQYISQNEKDWQQVWAVLDAEMVQDAAVKTVKYASLSFLYHLATSQCIITNYRLSLDVSKRKGQTYVQTWHSPLRLKKIEKDAEAHLPEQYIRMAKEDSQKIDYLLAGCADSKKIFEGSFWYDGPILEIGTPRIDPLLSPEKKKIAAIKSQLKIKREEKVLLYAPTFRKSGSLEGYISDFSKIVEALHSRWGEEWIVVTRLHPHLMHRAKEIFKDNRIIEASKHSDIQELLMITDFLITDYSSLMFDFLFTRKPVLLYIPDVEKYQKEERSLYYQPEDLPFLKAKSRGEAIREIGTFSSADYQKRLDNFIQKIGSYEKGNASEQLIEMLKQKIK